MLFLLLAAFAVHISAFHNPIKNPGQNPSVQFFNGSYYMVQTRNDAGIDVIRSQRLEDIGNGVFTDVWTAPPGTDVWAPELVYQRMENNTIWFIYYSELDKFGTNVLKSDSDNPEGPYHEMGRVMSDIDSHEVDSTVLEINKERYLVWSGWSSEHTKGNQCIFIAKINDATTFSSLSSLISEPTNSWEINEELKLGINEAPAALYRDGRTYIAYSANLRSSDDYCLGLLTYVGKDPLNKDSWQKSNGCVFSKNPEKSVYSPGHNSFTTSPNGQEIWNVYHATDVSGGAFESRSVRAQPVNWNSDGTPNFGDPVGFDDFVFENNFMHSEL